MRLSHTLKSQVHIERTSLHAPEVALNGSLTEFIRLSLLERLIFQIPFSEPCSSSSRNKNAPHDTQSSLLVKYCKRRSCTVREEWIIYPVLFQGDRLIKRNAAITECTIGVCSKGATENLADGQRGKPVSNSDIKQIFDAKKNNPETWET